MNSPGSVLFWLGALAVFCGLPLPVQVGVLVVGGPVLLAAWAVSEVQGWRARFRK